MSTMINSSMINNSEIVFRFESKWNLKTIICEVEYYEEYPLDDVSVVFLSILEQNEGQIDSMKLATMLGFNVIDCVVKGIKRYKDNAEIVLFNDFVNIVEEWGLLCRRDNYIIITSLGEYAFKAHKKYKFFKAIKGFYINMAMSTDNAENLFFPFNSEFGISTPITNTKQLEYNNIDIERCFNGEKDDLIKLLELSSTGIYNFYSANETRYIDLISISVNIDLYKNKDEYMPIIVKDGRICQIATELLLQESNISFRERKVEEGLYKKLMSDPHAILDYNTIIPFVDLLELESLIKDTRLKWSDVNLFEYIANVANANDWHNISLYCDVNVVKSFINTYRDRFDWILLSSRLDVDYILEHLLLYPWNFEIIRVREDISIDVIKRLILIPELRNEEWDWSEIMPELDRDFVINHLADINFDLSQISKDPDEKTKTAIALYPQKRWDWAYISTEYDLDYIFNNILKIYPYLNVEKVMDRFCVDSNWVSKIGSIATQFIDLFTNTPLFSVNSKNYKWTPRLVELFEQTGHLVWQSGKYQCGFECNPCISWNERVFNLYSNKTLTEKGCNYISSKVTDGKIVIDNPLFNWNWNIISQNNQLMNNVDFVLHMFNKIEVDSFVRIADWETIELVCAKEECLDAIGKDNNAILFFTQKSPIDFVRQNINFQWNWQVLTQRFCSTIKVPSLGNKKWIEKWDWDFLTANLAVEDIIEHIDLYTGFWNWDTLSLRIPVDFVRHNMPEYSSYWNWLTLLEDRLTKEDLTYDANLIPIVVCLSELSESVRMECWKVVTRKFDYCELELLIANTIRNNELAELCNWDYGYFYSLVEFNLLDYLECFKDCVSWEEISESSKLNDELYFDKRLSDQQVWRKDVVSILLNPEWHWDFEKLSRNENIFWTSSIVSDSRIINKNWDWSYISEFASFLKNGTDKTVAKFEKYLDFGSLSKRIDTQLTQDCIEKLSHKDWDWFALSSNETIQVSVDLMLRLDSKPWNWRILSYRKGLVFNEDLIKELIKNDLDWEFISKRFDFVPSNTVFELLEQHNIDWAIISRNENIEVENINNKYYELLDWVAISRLKNFPIKDIPNNKKMWDWVDWHYLSSQKKFPTSIEFVSLILDKNLNWSALSSNDMLPINIEALTKFEKYLDWEEINKRIGASISIELIEYFGDRLNWANVSKSQDIDFSERIIDAHKDKWYWRELVNNPKVIDNSIDLGKYKSKLNCVKFIEQFEIDSPKIYHFTHLFNAIEIIKSRKIMSRNKAEGKFANAAGNLVDRRDTAHEFARFYFRPQTPTQFYNECLGWDSQSGYMKSWRYWDGYWIECQKWVTYYPQAAILGLPKCPMPVFFEFDLQEVVSKLDEKCYYSTGNMQTNSAKIVKVVEAPQLLNTQKLYSTIDDGVEVYKSYSQQEFLVKNEFDFSVIESLKIICYDEEQASILRFELGDDEICDKISTNNNGVFHKNNRELFIESKDDTIILNSGYKGNACFLVRCKDIQNIEITNDENVLREGEGEIEIYPRVEIHKTDIPFEVYFIDKAISKREWLIYRN